MDLATFFCEELDEHSSVVADTKRLLTVPFARLVEIALHALRSGNKLLFFGNGGSAADAQHLATELTVRYNKNGRALAALALTTDTSALTAIGNDLGFEELFSRQIEAVGNSGDVAIAISTSGKSPNVVNAVKTAKHAGLITAAFLGKGGGEVGAVADVSLVVPSNNTARIQELHITLGQMLCGALEMALR